MSVGTERVIEGDAVYEKQEFLLRANLKQAGWRTARQNGLRVTEVHGRCYVRGRDWINYLQALIPDDTPVDPAAATA